MTDTHLPSTSGKVVPIAPGLEWRRDVTIVLSWLPLFPVPESRWIRWYSAVSAALGAALRRQILEAFPAEHRVRIQ